MRIALTRLLEESKRITGVDLREGVAEVKLTTSTLGQVYTTSTVVQVFLLERNEIGVMNKQAIFVQLNQLDSSYLVLLCLGGLGFTAGILVYTGLLGWAMGGLDYVVRGSIRRGFLLWARLFGSVSWPLFLAMVLGFLIVSWAAVEYAPGLTSFRALVPMFMGLTALPLDTEQNNRASFGRMTRARLIG